MIAADVDWSGALANAGALAFLTLITAAGAAFARRAYKGGQALREATDVPTPDDGKVNIGEAIAALRRELTEAWNYQMDQQQLSFHELQRGQERIADEVKSVQMLQAEHTGEHRGLQRDVDWMMRKLRNGEGHGEHNHDG